MIINLLQGNYCKPVTVKKMEDNFAKHAVNVNHDYVPGKHKRDATQMEEEASECQLKQLFIQDSFHYSHCIYNWPVAREGLSSSNSSVLYLRASNIMHCGLGFKYHSFSRLVVSSTEFGEVTVKFRPSNLPWWRSMLHLTIYTPFALAVLP